MQLNTDDFLEGHFGGEENGTAHTGAHIDEGKVGDWSGRPGALPSTDQPLKDGGRDTVVGRGVAIMAVAALEVPAGDEAAGADSMGEIEGVAHETVGDRESGQLPSGAWLVCRLHGCTLRPTHSAGSGFWLLAARFFTWRWARLRRPSPILQIKGCIDQCDMREGLREVPDQALEFGIVLLREQAQVVAQSRAGG